MQGLGYYLTEHVGFDAQGRLTTNGTWNYKPPGLRDIPLEFNVTLIPPPPPSSTLSSSSSSSVATAAAAAAAATATKTKAKKEEEEEEEEEGRKDGLVLSSKATGEPPYMLASSAYFGLIGAIREGRRGWREGGKEGQDEEEDIALAIPATIEERVKAVDVPVAAFVLT